MNEKPHPSTKEGKKYMEQVYKEFLGEYDVTPSGYKAGPVKASDGTVYEVQATGQFLCTTRKMTKAERKRHKRERRQQRGNQRVKIDSI